MVDGVVAVLVGRWVPYRTTAGRDHLGSHTGKIFVVSKNLGYQLSALSEARHVEVAAAPLVARSGAKGKAISREGIRQLTRAVDRVLGRRRDATSTRG